MNQSDGPANECSDTSSRSTDMTRAEHPAKLRWFDIVECLSSPTLEPSDIRKLLSQAMSATFEDSDWSSSGITELLTRAHNSAIRGYTDSAKKAALNLLDFHKVVLKYRQCPSPAAGKKARANTNSSENSDGGQQDTLETAGSGDSSSLRANVEETVIFQPPDSRVEEVMNTSSNERKRQRPDMATWSGSIVFLGEGAQCLGAELCSVSMQVPAEVLPEFPASVMVASGMVLRKAVILQNRLACSTTIIAATPAQEKQLKCMAEAEVVVMMPLQPDCDAVLVPYKSDDGKLKVVTFLAEILV
ncbi:hypothetical protein CEUSTIGMA_g11197.t1 [Chlamydomonas eustigma]|uniref:Uncharacterized protein n=1 Tax=Chlamydomonas eustigma TaxID=1157962 RepID=A0A250XLK3_9CHLO|nr:hypothetical protein CEUSTIGMA_g11197.t1 [Chlamydomonas eustigma]|eukprot:GAX83772.1 hypothetical protein CEUSTIGMA_g11197.t1 [Chlamydomonas eustigma]